MDFMTSTPIQPWVFLAILCGAGPLVLLGICFYRLVFHPYAKYPGPFLAKITSWYSIYHTQVGDLHTDVWRCHQKYGDVVRYGPNRLLLNTEPAFKGIYGRGQNVCKSKSYLRLSLVPGVQPIVTTIDNQKHGKLRRILNQGLSDAHIRTMDPELRRVTATFVHTVTEAQDRFHPMSESVSGEGDGWSAAKNMAQWCDYFTFDVMSQLVFATSYDMLASADNHWIIDGVLGQLRRISFLHNLPELEDMGLHRFLFPDWRRKAVQFSGKSRQIMEARKEREKAKDEHGHEKVDLFSRLFAAKDSETGEGLSHKQLWAESNLLIVAGSDTSSTGLAATFFYLSRNPSAYARVTQEVRAVFPSPDAVCQGPKLLSCIYLRACIQEATRLVPSAGGAMWREVLPGGLHVPNAGTDLYIPAGCEVGTGIWSLNHNETYYPEPFAFRPERWIAAEVGDEAVARAKAAYATFLFGPRNCVGKTLAMTEISLAMAAIISGYDFRRPETKLGDVGEETEGAFKEQYKVFWAFASFKDGPYIQFRPLDAGSS